MADIDPRLISALTAQLVSRQRLLNAGAVSIGWKLGMGKRERIGTGPVIGYLTSATCLKSGTEYHSGGVATLHADAELALELGADTQIVGYGPALELVDLDGGEKPGQIVAANVFHRAVVFGPMRPALTALEGRLLIDGHVRAAAPLASGHARLVDHVSKLLAMVGERLVAGDRLITGSIVQLPVRPGDRVAADLETLGSAEAVIT